MTLKQALLYTLLCLITPLASAQAPAGPTRSVTGTVTNLTTNKPSANDDVTLLQLTQGMSEIARSKTDARGHFSIKVPVDGMYLLRVNHDKANYFQPIQPGTDTVELNVYSAAPTLEGITTEADVMSIQTDAGGSGLKVVEHFFVKNDSTPPKTLFNDHPFEFYLPKEAVIAGAAEKAPGGMAVQASPVPMGDTPGHYTIIFPLRPGQTEFQVSYSLPYKDSYTFHPKTASAVGTLALMMPKSMTFKPGNPTTYSPVTEELNAQTYVARNIQPSEPADFTISGSGQLPRDNGPAQSGQAADASQGSAASQDPNNDTRPGIGLGTPLDKDANREPLAKYRWWIIAALALLFAAGAGFMLKSPAPAAAVATSTAQSHASTPRGALQVLRDEMFSLETDRMTGKLSDTQYAELKSAYDTVLKRTLDRTQT